MTLDYSSLDPYVMWGTRKWASFTLIVTNFIVPNSLQKNPAFENFVWLFEGIQKLTLEECKDLVSFH